MWKYSSLWINKTRPDTKHLRLWWLDAMTELCCCSAQTEAQTLVVLRKWTWLYSKPCKNFLFTKTGNGKSLAHGLQFLNSWLTQSWKTKAKGDRRQTHSTNQTNYPAIEDEENVILIQTHTNGPWNRIEPWKRHMRVELFKYFIGKMDSL